MLIQLYFINYNILQYLNIVKLKYKNNNIFNIDKYYMENKDKVKQ